MSYNPIDPQEMSAGELMDMLLQQLIEDGGVTHVPAKVQNQDTGEEQVLVLHIHVENIMSVEDFAAALEEAVNASERENQGNEPVLQ